MLELARCEYVARRENIIALGNSGTGKTHEVTIAFAPRAAGGVAGYLEVISDDSASMGLPVQIAVDGTADQLSAGSRSGQAVRSQRSTSRGLLIASAARGGARRRKCLLNGVILVILTHRSAPGSTFPGSGYLPAFSRRADRSGYGGASDQRPDGKNQRRRVIGRQR